MTGSQKQKFHDSPQRGGIATKIKEKAFVSGFYESPGSKIQGLESGRFGKSEYRHKIFVFLHRFNFKVTGIRKYFKRAWTRFWMHRAGLSRFGRMATRYATSFTPPYYGRRSLARLNPKGYISPSAVIHHADLRLGPNVFIGDRVTIFQDAEGGMVELGERVHLYGDTYIQTGQGGSISIGANTHIQPRCQFSAYKAAIRIGRDVQIAPNCGFYPYDHGIAPNTPIIKQPLQTKGDIIIDDDAWLGYGAIVLSGVRIGKGAAIGAGAVVTRDIPDGAVAVGSPARVVKMRRHTAPNAATHPAKTSSKIKEPAI